MSDHTLPSMAARRFSLLLHFVSSDVSSFGLIYSRQMRQEYLQELYYSFVSGCSSALECVCASTALLRSLPSPCETNNPSSTAPVPAGPCPWLCQIKPRPSTGRLRVSSRPWGWGTAARAAPTPVMEPHAARVSATGTSPYPPHSQPWLSPPNCFGVLRHQCRQPVLPHPPSPAECCWDY